MRYQVTYIANGYYGVRDTDANGYRLAAAPWTAYRGNVHAGSKKEATAFAKRLNETGLAEGEWTL